MTRIEKINFIKTRFPSLYPALRSKVPNIFKDPISATNEEISLYNLYLTHFLKPLRYGSSFIEMLKF